jgi:hypothetical protein
MKNLTYDQLIELAPKYRPFQIEVEMLERTLEDILSELSDTDKEIIKSKLK